MNMGSSGMSCVGPLPGPLGPLPRSYDTGGPAKLILEDPHRCRTLPGPSILYICVYGVFLIELRPHDSKCA